MSGFQGGHLDTELLEAEAGSAVEAWAPPHIIRGGAGSRLELCEGHVGVVSGCTAPGPGLWTTPVFMNILCE